jgi:hypothetical protein
MKGNRTVRKIDWRVWAVIVAGGATIVATVIVYWLGLGLNPATHFGAVFASWVGGVALFLIAGSVVALVSLSRPEAEPFDARARILFRRQSGKHVDYIVDKIKEVLEHYAEGTSLKISVRAYNAAEKKFRVSAQSTVRVRSYLDDIETTYVSLLSRNNVCAPPPGGEPNRLVYARVAGNPACAADEFAGSIERPISCRIERNGECEVASLFEYWIAADDEPNTHTTRRYTQALTLEIENVMGAGQALGVKLTIDGTNWVTEHLPPGISKQVLELKDIKPGVSVFDYRLIGA